MIGSCATNPPKDENACNDFSDCILNSIPNSILGDEDFSNALGPFYYAIFSLVNEKCSFGQ